MTLYYGAGFDHRITEALDVRDRLPKDRRHHYTDGYSMAELAKLWASRPGRLPPRVAHAIGDDRLDSAHFEYEVKVWGGGTSVTDLMAFTPHGVIAIEAKTDEPFDQIVEHWIDAQAARNPRSPAHRHKTAARYADAMRLPFAEVLRLRYQLLHRTLSAARAAQASDADRAWMMVQSFPTIGRMPRCTTQRSDFDLFVSLVGETVVLEDRSVCLTWIDEPLSS